MSINIDSAATILQAANMHIANDLRQSCLDLGRCLAWSPRGMDFILRNFDAVSKTPAFEDMFIHFPSFSQFSGHFLAIWAGGSS